MTLWLYISLIISFVWLNEALASASVTTFIRSTDLSSQIFTLFKLAWSLLLRLGSHGWHNYLVILFGCQMFLARWLLPISYSSQASRCFWPIQFLIHFLLTFRAWSHRHTCLTFWRLISFESSDHILCALLVRRLPQMSCMGI